MKCPRCVSEISYGALVCGECGFSILDQESLLGNDAVCLARVTNANHAFSDAELAQLDAALDQFEAQFPQLFFAVYSAALPSSMKLREFAFWLLNRAAIPALEITRPNENGCLLILEETSGEAALVVGYLLECYFPDVELRKILSKGKRAWGRGKMVEGVLAVIENFSIALVKKSLEAAKNPVQFQPVIHPEPPMPEFQRLHDGMPMDSSLVNGEHDSPSKEHSP